MRSLDVSVPFRRTGWLVAALCALVCGCGGSTGSTEDEQSADRPMNIVLLLADDLGFNDLSVQGSTIVVTPYIDALATQGARMTNTYATAATCSPSRAALMSGQYQNRFGFEFNTGRGIARELGRGLAPHVVTIADLLAEAGYVTGAVGKWHLGSQDHLHPLERGFDEFFGFLAGQHKYFPDPAGKREPWQTVMRGTEHANETEYLTDAFAREAVSFIEEHNDEPFFLYVAFNAVHAPIEAPEHYLEHYPHIESERQRTYYGMVSALDDAVGAILAALEDTGLADDTLVVLTNDNGGLASPGDLSGGAVPPVADNQPLRLSKGFLFEGGVRVPMIVRWPGVTEAGQVFDGVASLLDLFPTFLGVAGVDPPAELVLDGVDLHPHLGGEVVGSPHELLFWRSGPNLAVRQAQWKLIRAGDHVWLFDLEADIGERTNLARDHPDVVDALLDALDDWQSEMQDPAWPSRRCIGAVLVDGVFYEIHV